MAISRLQFSDTGLSAKFDIGSSTPIPTLLPAFEPCSSPPDSLPRLSKRKFEQSPCKRTADLIRYPTPAPTSSTTVVPSSPSQSRPTRPGLTRAPSTMTERVPLGALPSVQIPSDGEEILMGRSSNSSHYQLSSSRLISRVHVRGTYRSATEDHEDGEVVIECMGWNGVKVHCRGRVYDLGKGDTFRSDRPQADIMLDVQDARVLVKWPSMRSVSAFSDVWDREELSRRLTTSAEHFPSSPPMASAQLQSPVSPSPRRPTFDANTTFIGLPSSESPPPAVEVYEDAASEEEHIPRVKVETPDPQDLEVAVDCKESDSSSSLSDPGEDEENDPTVHALSPFGANILPRIATMTAAASPDQPRQPLKATVSPQQKLLPKLHRNASFSAVRNHVINQLAYSRLHSLPMSTIMNNLPASLKQADASPGHVENSPSPAFTDNDLEDLLLEIACIGEIEREGKDAAGKPLENEFYYIPDLDADEMRRTAVQGGLGKTSLRAVRKQHKQYYWKRPRF